MGCKGSRVQISALRPLRRSSCTAQDIRSPCGPGMWSIRLRRTVCRNHFRNSCVVVSVRRHRLDELRDGAAVVTAPPYERQYPKHASPEEKRWCRLSSRAVAKRGDESRRLQVGPAVLCCRAPSEVRDEVAGWAVGLRAANSGRDLSSMIDLGTVESARAQLHDAGFVVVADVLPGTDGNRLAALLAPPADGRVGSRWPGQ